MFFYSRDRGGEHPRRHLSSWGRHPAGRRLCGFGGLYEARRSPRPIAEAACWAHGRRKFFVLAELRQVPLAIEAVRRIDEIFAVRARDQRRRAPSSGRPSDSNGSSRWSPHWKAGCGPRGPAVAPRRDRQSHRLHAEALACLHAVSRRRADLPEQHAARTSIARNCKRPPRVVIRRLRSGWRTCRRDVHADRDRQVERRRSAGLAHRRAPPHRRSSSL